MKKQKADLEAKLHEIQDSLEEIMKQQLDTEHELDARSRLRLEAWNLENTFAQEQEGGDANFARPPVETLRMEEQFINQKIKIAKKHHATKIREQQQPPPISTATQEAKVTRGGYAN